MPLNLIISIHLIFTLIYICSEKLNIKNNTSKIIRKHMHKSINELYNPIWCKKNII